MRHAFFAVVLVAALALPTLGAARAALDNVYATPLVVANCPSCVASNNVISVPLGAEVTFQASDSNRPIFQVLWSFGEVGLSAKHRFTVPGKHDVVATVVYLDTPPAQVTTTVHVVAAPVVNGRTLFGIPTDIAYPILSALATMLLYYINSYIGG